MWPSWVIYYRSIQKNVKKWNCLSQKNLQTWFEQFFVKPTISLLIVKNIMKNQKFNFPVKLFDIRKNINK